MKRPQVLCSFPSLCVILTVCTLTAGAQSKLFAIHNSDNSVQRQSNNNNDNNMPNNVFLHHNARADNTLNFANQWDHRDAKRKPKILHQLRNIKSHNNDSNNDDSTVYSGHEKPQKQQVQHQTQHKITLYSSNDVDNNDDDVKDKEDNKGFVIIMGNKKRTNEKVAMWGTLAVFLILRQHQQQSKLAKITASTTTADTELSMSDVPQKAAAVEAAAQPSPPFELTPYSATSGAPDKPSDMRFHGWDAFYNPFGQSVLMLPGGNNALHLPGYSLWFNADRHTLFQLHTQAPAGTKVHVEQVHLYDAASLRQSRFNPFNPTRILVHGWLGGSHASLFSTLVPAYLRRDSGAYNVFTVDWGRGAVADYLTASYRVKPVGQVLAKFLDFLHREANMLFENVHVVGFSMGAHIAGIAGKHLQTGRLPVIYALDPALQLFRYEQRDERVADSDADYVEVIHTSAGSYGYDRPLGHVDFYVNWGSSQPGCFFNECSHFRAFRVFSDSLDGHLSGLGCDAAAWQDLIKHRRCEKSTGRMRTLGGDPSENATTELLRNTGLYYVDTNTGSPPYFKRAQGGK